MMPISDILSRPDDIQPLGRSEAGGFRPVSVAAKVSLAFRKSPVRGSYPEARSGNIQDEQHPQQELEATSGNNVEELLITKQYFAP